MSVSLHKLSGINVNQVKQVSLNLQDVALPKNIYKKLLDFLQEKIEGKYILNNETDGAKLIKTCREELLRKYDTNIKSLDVDVKRNLQRLIGEYLFEILPESKQKEIIEAVIETGHETLHVKLDIENTDDEYILFSPWEFLRCSKEILIKHQKVEAKAFWLSGNENTLFYRMMNLHEGGLRERNAKINVLVVDATTEQKVYNFISTGEVDDPRNPGNKVKFRTCFSNIEFNLLGKSEGSERAAFANISESVDLSNPHIVHLVVDSFSSKENKNFLGLLKPDVNDDGRVEQEYSESAIEDGDLNWLISGEKRASVFVIQEWKSTDQSPFYSLEKIAYLLSKNNIPSILIIPYQEIFPGVKDYFESFYQGLSNGETIGNAVHKLRLSFFKKQCYNLPLFYLNNKDFTLLDTIKSPPNPENKLSPQDAKTLERSSQYIDSLGEYLKEADKETGNTKVALIIKIKELRSSLQKYYNENKDLLNRHHNNDFISEVCKVDPDFKQLFGS